MPEIKWIIYTFMLNWASVIPETRYFILSVSYKGICIWLSLRECAVQTIMFPNLYIIYQIISESGTVSMNLPIISLPIFYEYGSRNILKTSDCYLEVHFPMNWKTKAIWLGKCQVKLCEAKMLITRGHSLGNLN